MITRSCFIILCCMIAGLQPLYASSQVKQIQSFPSFGRVEISGRVDVSLHTGFKNSGILLFGDPDDLKNTSVSVADNVLKINVGEGYPKCGAIKVEVRAHRLSAFQFKGIGRIFGNKLHTERLHLNLDNKGTVKLGGYIGLARLDVAGGGHVEINNVHSKHLQLNITDGSRVTLQGAANVSTINMDGKSWMKFHWVKSRIIRINGKGESCLQLAGAAQQLHVTLCDAARFNGRYLRANRAFVKTYGHSVAEISAVKRQHTLASDASDIHFYNIPTLKTDFMAFNGSVLDMRDWDMPFMQEYTEYNK